MASISLTQALEISTASIYGAYLKTRQSDQLYVRVPKVPVNGDALQVAAVNTLATAAFIATGADVDVTAKTYDGSACTFSLRRIAARVDNDAFIALNVSQKSDVFQQQILAKKIAIWNAVGDMLINGTGSSPQPSGLIT